MEAYPTRPKFFANKVVRLLGKSCAAQDIGATGVLLVTWVVMTEDAAMYRRAVTFWDAQLMPIIGLSSQKALATARSKAVESGWLHYEAGSKGRAGVYWATIPPHADGVDDAPSDEGHDPDESETFDVKKTANRATDRGRSNGESGGESGTIGQGKGQPSIPTPVPSPIPNTKTHGRADGSLKKFWLWKDATRKEINSPAGANRVYQHALSLGACTDSDQIKVFGLVLAICSDKKIKNPAGAITAAFRGKGMTPWRARGDPFETTARGWWRSVDVPPAMQARTSNLGSTVDADAEKKRQRDALLSRVKN